MLIFGYTRVSSEGQDLARQIQAIKEYRPNIEDNNIFKDTATGKTFDRPQYELMKQIISRVVHGGEPVELIIEEFDRLGRNKAQIKEELAWFQLCGDTLWSDPATRYNKTGASRYAPAEVSERS